MQKHQASKCDFPSRNTAAFIPHMHHLQTISAHTSMVRWACSVLTLPLTNSGSISPSRRHQAHSRRHQATTHAVQGGAGLPHAQQPHSELIQKSRRIKKKRANCILQKKTFPAGKSHILWKPQPCPKILFGEIPAPQPFAQGVSRREPKPAE